MNVFHTPETTMTPQEAEAVVRRFLERTADAPTGPSVADVAEALRTSPQEVARILAEVRAAPKAKPQRQTIRRERRVWLLSGVAASILGAVALGLMNMAKIGPFAPFVPTVVQIGGPYEPYQVQIDGRDRGDIHYEDQKGPPSIEIPNLVDRWFREDKAAFGPPRSYGAEAAQRGIQAAEEGRWKDIQGVRMIAFDLRKSTERGFMRWARATIPVYRGDDSLIADAVARERKRRIEAAVALALEGVPELSKPVSAPR